VRLTKKKVEKKITIISKDLKKYRHKGIEVLAQKMNSIFFRSEWLVLYGNEIYILSDKEFKESYDLIKEDIKEKIMLK